MEGGFYKSLAFIWSKVIFSYPGIVGHSPIIPSGHRYHHIILRPVGYSCGEFQFRRRAIHAAEMQRFMVPCECGGGAKLFLKAGEHPDRFYYRCPKKLRTCSFVWADELLTNKHSSLHPFIVPVPSVFSDNQSAGVRWRSGGSQINLKVELSEQASSRAYCVRDAYELSSRASSA